MPRRTGASLSETGPRVERTGENGIQFFKNPLQFWTPTAAEQALNPSRRFISVEIEVAGLGKTGNETNAAVHKWRGCIVADGSLPHGGFEINTAPAGGDLFVKQIREICKALAAQDAKTTGACGLHVHVDARDFSADDIARLMRLYGKIEAGLFAIIKRSRRKSRFTRKCAEQYLQALQTSRRSLDERLNVAIYGQFNPGRRDKQKYDSARYAALNLHSWKFRGTVENRMFAGTVQAYRIINWGLLWASILDYVKTHIDEEIDAIRAETVVDQIGLLKQLSPNDTVVKWITVRASKCLAAAREAAIAADNETMTENNEGAAA